MQNLKPTVMKFLPMFLFLMIALFINAQNKIEAELLMSVDTVQAPKVKIRSCYVSICDKNPLFVVDGVPVSKEYLKDITPNDVVSISVMKDGSSIFCDGNAKNGVVLITTKKGHSIPLKTRKEYPFKVYEIRNTNWTITQDMYNSIIARVPSLNISNSLMGKTPKISMRGNDNTIVIVDGIRYDASILTTLDLNNIESVKVSNSPLAQNYFTYH